MLRNLNITLAELRSIVSTNDKQRFSMIPASQIDNAPSSSSMAADPNIEASAVDPLSTFSSDNPSDYLIRANQGHSITVDTEGLLTEITLEANNVPSTVVHGTDEAAFRMILLGGGLRRMGRTHIHFASGLPAGFKSLGSASPEEEEKVQAPVISGMRRSATVLIYIDIRAALEAGIKFFISENSVILTVGEENDQVLSYKYFTRVENRKQGKVVMENGVLPGGVVVDVEEWKKKVGDMSKQRGGGGRGRGGRGGGSGGGGGRGGKPTGTDDSNNLMTDADK